MMRMLTTRLIPMALLTGQPMNSITPVILVVLHGKFKDPNARVPSGAPIPAGTEINFTIDPTTHAIYDFGISN